MNELPSQSQLNVHATQFFPHSSHLHFNLGLHTNSFPTDDINVSTAMIKRVIGWGFSPKIVEHVEKVIREWFSSNTLNRVLREWERKEEVGSTQQIPLQVLTYDVQGWGRRAIETTVLIFNTDSSVGILTEVAELWGSAPIPHDRSYYQQGTNGKGGVVMAVGRI